MGESQEHKFDKNHIKKHIKTSSGDGGACLTRHISDVTGSSCSHRWQAYRKATEYPHWYNYPAYDPLIKKQGENYIEETIQWGHHFKGKFKRPSAGEWDLGASSFISKKRPQGFPNFQKWTKAPYWHQAHHIIPNRVLQDCILEAAAVDMRLHWLIRAALLDAPYNLNYKDNMFLLPMSKKIAAVLGLPRHIAGIESEPGVSPQIANHKTYSDNIKKKVDKVLKEFAKQIALEKHDEDAPAFAKEQLEQISTTVFMKLKTWAKSAQGASLDSFPVGWF